MESIIININYCYNYNTFNEVDSFYSLDILKFTVSICPAAGHINTSFKIRDILPIKLKACT